MNSLLIISLMDGILRFIVGIEMLGMDKFGIVNVGIDGMLMLGIDGIEMLGMEGIETGK